jgi:hypothetical protein
MSGQILELVEDIVGFGSPVDHIAQEDQGVIGVRLDSIEQRGQGVPAAVDVSDRYRAA